VHLFNAGQPKNLDRGAKREKSGKKGAGVGYEKAQDKRSKAEVHHKAISLYKIHPDAVMKNVKRHGRKGGKGKEDKTVPLSQEL